MQDAQTNDPVGARLHYRKYGSGPPLIVLHGFLGSSGNWHTLASRAFSPEFETYAVDQRDHGRSPHTDHIDYVSLSEDVLAFMDANGLRYAHLLGHSMGGKVAMDFALRYPDRVRKLVVVDIALRAYPPEHRVLLDALRSADLSTASSRADVDGQLRSSIPVPAVRQFLLKNLGYDSAEKRYFWEMNLDLLSRQYDQLTEPIQTGRTFDGATLFVRGEKSTYIGQSDEAQLRTTFPNARIETVEGAGHWVHADSPERFAQLVTAFLREN